MILPSVLVTTPLVAMVIVPVLLNVPANKLRLVTVNVELVGNVVDARFMVKVFKACAPAKVTAAGNAPEPLTINDELASILKLPLVLT